jgi:two-component sensor histidine kinase
MVPLDRLFGWFVGDRRLPGFATAAVSVGAGMAVRLALLDTFRGFPFVTFYPAVLITALVGGWLPAVAAAAVALPFSWYFLIGWESGFNWSPSAIIGAASDTLVVAVIIALVEIIRAAARSLQARQANTEALLIERDAMLRELQHRIANNMQFIGSWLSLQANRVSAGDSGRRALREAASRLVLFGAVHRKLYDPRLSTRGFESIAREILTDLLRGSGAERVALEVRAATIPLPLDVTTNLMLIVTEAATNSIKHVFSKHAGSRLSVTLERIGKEEAALTIADDGPGLAPSDDARIEGLGLKLVESLARPFHGSVRMESVSGAVLTITFPIPSATPLPPAGAAGAEPPLTPSGVEDAGSRRGLRPSVA